MAIIRLRKAVQAPVLPAQDVPDMKQTSIIFNTIANKTRKKKI